MWVSTGWQSRSWRKDSDPGCRASSHRSWLRACWTKRNSCSCPTRRASRSRPSPSASRRARHERTRSSGVPARSSLWAHKCLSSLRPSRSHTLTPRPCVPRLEPTAPLLQLRPQRGTRAIAQAAPSAESLAAPGRRRGLERPDVPQRQEPVRRGPTPTLNASSPSFAAPASSPSASAHAAADRSSQSRPAPTGTFSFTVVPP